MAEPSSSRRTGTRAGGSPSSSSSVVASTSTQPPETTYAPSSPSSTHIATAPAPPPVATSTVETQSRVQSPKVEPLSEYTCPICFFPPTNATLTPCGHICCGSCLFTAVKSTIQRGALMRAEANVARCPVCRADIPGWDGRGGGVIGLKPRTVLSL
ncbi:putative zinc finger, C3HC4 type (RING finger) [Lyophyllum shimeji]|uniref:Zinc finger, C3HC4 type (RING finger) n=1 Tax=Lyophyllum shimeji TaxID=47721 RepID=A0A9P3UTL6_LYOSH|nr:putative zinc finger, C3HC4 type (RING finger) [Lyophyllum shimeji]